MSMETSRPSGAARARSAMLSRIANTPVPVCAYTQGLRGSAAYGKLASQASHARVTRTTAARIVAPTGHLDWIAAMPAPASKANAKTMLTAHQGVLYGTTEYAPARMIA